MLLVEELMKAEKSIDVVVAWLTNQSLIDVLTYKQSKGVRVRVAVNDDHINKSSRFTALRKAGGVIERICASGGGVMHNKFCLIDESTLITGSYNWTLNAERGNEESVTVARNGDFDIKSYDKKLCSIFSDKDNPKIVVAKFLGQCPKNEDIDNIVKMPYNLVRMFLLLNVLGKRFMWDLAFQMQPYMRIEKDKACSLDSSVPHSYEVLRKNKCGTAEAARILSMTERLKEVEKLLGVNIFSEATPIVERKHMDGKECDFVRGLRFCFTDVGISFVSDMSKGYVKCGKKFIMNTASPNDANIYIMLSRYYGFRHRRNFVVPYSEFEYWAGFENKYSKWSSVKKYVLDKAQERIAAMKKNGLSQFSFSFEPVYPKTRKSGYPLGLLFKIDNT